MKLITSLASSPISSSPTESDEAGIITFNAIEASYVREDKVVVVEVGESVPIRVTLQSMLPSSVNISGLVLVLKESQREPPKDVQRVSDGGAHSVEEGGEREREREREIMCPLLIKVEVEETQMELQPESELELQPGLTTRLTFLASPHLPGTFSATR